MLQLPLVTSSTVVPVERFWNSVVLYHDRPNLVNRKLVGVSPSVFAELDFDHAKTRRPSEIFRREALVYELRKLNELKDISLQYIENVVEGYNIGVIKSDWDTFHSNYSSFFISVRILWPRQKNKPCLEVVLFDKENKIASFFAVHQDHDSATIAPPFFYHLDLTSENNLRILVDSFEDADTTSSEWLAEKLFPALLKWSETDLEVDYVKSLSMVDIEAYCCLYNDLKCKYADNLMEVWQKLAKTDPKKFVYEDLAIASYLICLWRKLQVTNINFVDLGCGNGLLVYILTKEGFKGKGVDLRRRQLWDFFQNEAVLQEETFTPTSQYPEATWLIGNHSDELTPWIPVVALKNSPETNFFVLPCCPYDFNGQKYIRQNSKVSQYSDYMDYIQEVSTKCGFDTFVDKLRIPSTKRTCLIGVRRSNQDGNVEKVDEIINSRLGAGFAARSSVEAVRNCTQLDKDLIRRILNSIVKHLLTFEDYTKKNWQGQPWNKGGVTSISQLPKVIPKEDLKMLKSNCGGLQTLLRNHRYLFELHANGFVSLREPRTLNEDTKKYKNKPCWFERNHPNGCLYRSDICAYKHEK